MTPATLFVRQQPASAGTAARCPPPPSARTGSAWPASRPTPRSAPARPPSRDFDIDGYDVVVLQQRPGPVGQAIRSWQDRGVDVLYEIDDYGSTGSASSSHTAAGNFTREAVARLDCACGSPTGWSARPSGSPAASAR